MQINNQDLLNLVKLINAIDFYDGLQPRVTYDIEVLREVWPRLVILRSQIEYKSSNNTGQGVE